MNYEERKNFWNLLCSLTGDDIVADKDALIKAIKYPKFLYRYRPVNINNLEALRTNKLYFSSANYYDDPFDTFLHIDINTIKKEFLNDFSTLEKTQLVIDNLKTMLDGVLTEEQKSQLNVENLKYAVNNGLLDRFLNTALILRDELKKDAWSVCFSENGFNETLWLKYADQHKGFALIYDLENQQNILCGKQEKCKNCGIHNYGTPLYPICYSDKPYDATNFAKRVMLYKLEEMAKKQFPEELHEILGNGAWERERVTLIKKECHKYDEEWRMVTGCIMKSPIMMEWIPSGIILGLRMNKPDENIVMSMAKEAGIKKIYKSFIDSSNQLNAFPVYIKD